MKALTLWRPWDHAILYLGKRIENRPWRPHADVVGKMIALHAGKVWDAAGVVAIERILGRTMPIVTSWAGHIVGVARVVGCVTHERRLSPDQQPWFFGPYGWLLEDVEALASMPCRGAQGLWPVPEDLERRVLAQLSQGRFDLTPALAPRR